MRCIYNVAGDTTVIIFSGEHDVEPLPKKGDSTIIFLGGGPFRVEGGGAFWGLPHPTKIPAGAHAICSGVMHECASAMP